jgi:hypothetical protein
MSHQHLFEPLIGARPPSTLDLDAFIARQRRAQRNRRIAAAGAGVAVTLVIVLGAAVAATILRGGPAVTGPGGPPPTGGGYLPPTDPAAFHAATTARLTTAALAAVPAVRPDVTLADNAEVPGTGVLEFGHNRPSLAPPNVPDTYYASADVRDGEGLGLIEIAVGYTVDEQDRFRVDGWPTWPDLFLDLQCPPPAEERLSDCSASTGPNGERIVAKTRYLVDGELVDGPTAGAATEYEVHVTKPDGTQIQLWSANFARYQPGGRFGPYDRTEPPFSPEQLAEVALRPGLTFYE